MPVPASSTSSVPSSPRTSTLERVAAVARGLRSRRRDRAARAEQRQAHGGSSSQNSATAPRNSSLEPDDRDRGDLDVAAHAVHALDEEPLVGRPAARERHHQRQVGGRNRPVVLVERREDLRPARGRHLAGLLEALAEDALGRLVVEQEIAVGIDEEQRHAEVAGQLPRQDDLNRQTHRSPPAPRQVCAANAPDGNGRMRRRSAGAAPGVMQVFTLPAQDLARP